MHSVNEVEFLLLDLLTHMPSPEPQRYQKKADQNNHDSVDGNKTRDRKGNMQH